MVRQNFSCVEFHKHRPISFHLFKGHCKSEVVQQQELQFQVVKFGEGKATDLFSC